MSDEYDRGAPIDRESWETESRANDADRTADDGTDEGDEPETVSARDSDTQLLSRFEHEGIACELGGDDGTLCGFVRLPPGVDRLHLLWELDPPGEFGYGPDADGWIGFETGTDGVEPQEAAVALAGLAKQVAERARSSPE